MMCCFFTEIRRQKKERPITKPTSFSVSDLIKKENKNIILCEFCRKIFICLAYIPYQLGTPEFDSIVCKIGPLDEPSFHSGPLLCIQFPDLVSYFLREQPRTSLFSVPRYSCFSPSVSHCGASTNYSYISVRMVNCSTTPLKNQRTSTSISIRECRFFT